MIIAREAISRSFLFVLDLIVKTTKSFNRGRSFPTNLLFWHALIRSAQHQVIPSFLQILFVIIIQAGVISNILVALLYPIWSFQESSWKQMKPYHTIMVYLNLQESQISHHHWDMTESFLLAMTIETIPSAKEAKFASPTCNQSSLNESSVSKNTYHHKRENNYHVFYSYQNDRWRPGFRIEEQNGGVSRWRLKCEDEWPMTKWQGKYSK